MKMKRTCYPPKIFDDTLCALVRLIEAKGWTFPGIDLDQLEADVAAQRAQRVEHDALRSQYLALHETFGLAQEARYQLFLKALYAIRGAFCSDKAVMAELERFKRSTGRARKVADEAA